jgi:hypothetical protein
MISVTDYGVTRRYADMSVLLMIGDHSDSCGIADVYTIPDGETTDVV